LRRLEARPCHATAFAVNFGQNDFADGPEPRPDDSPIEVKEQRCDAEDERAANPMVRVKIVRAEKAADQSETDKNPTIWNARWARRRRGGGRGLNFEISARGKRGDVGVHANGVTAAGEIFAERGPGRALLKIVQEADFVSVEFAFDFGPGEWTRDTSTPAQMKLVKFAHGVVRRIGGKDSGAFTAAMEKPRVCNVEFTRSFAFPANTNSGENGSARTSGCERSFGETELKISCAGSFAAVSA
jgi:hypothetical protein